MLATPPILTTTSGPLPLQQLGKRAMIDRDKGCTLPTRGDIGGTEIMHDRNVDRLRERVAIADLHSHFLRRPVQHGLAVESRHIGMRAVAAFTAQNGISCETSILSAFTARPCAPARRRK